MKKALSILLTLMMLVGILAVSAVSVSAAVKTTDSAFTDNYVLLDYIQNTNGQYIKTGYNAGANVTVSMDLEITAWNHTYSAIFGSRSSNHASNSFVMCRNNGNNGERTEIGNSNYTYPSVGLNTRSTLSLSGTDKFSGTGLEIYLFGLNQNNAFDTAWGTATYKLYSCKITDGGTVVRDYVPAQRKSDKTVGLYDLQNGKFYESASTKPFEKNTTKTTDSAFTDNYVLLKYIQNTNGQYIKTGYKTGANVTIDIDLEFTDWGGTWSNIFGACDIYTGDTFYLVRNNNKNELRFEIGNGNGLDYFYYSASQDTRTTLSVGGNGHFSGAQNELYLFAVDNKGSLRSGANAIYKLYSCKITDGDEVVRDFVPAQRKSDGAVGLYDLQNGKFYQSASANPFDNKAIKTTDSAFTGRYNLLDYIENTDGQYIKTGYNAGPDVTVTMLAASLRGSYNRALLFGSRSSQSSENSFIAYYFDGYSHSTYLYDAYLNTEIGKEVHTEFLYTTHTSFADDSLFRPYTITVSGTKNFKGTGLEMYLFGINQNGSFSTNSLTFYNATVRLYSCKITDGGKVVRDFVPAQRKSDGAVGLFDLQNGDFYQSASETGFAKTATHTTHSYDKDGKCTICGRTLNLNNYGLSYSKTQTNGFTIAFPGATGVVFKIDGYNSRAMEAYLKMCGHNENGEKIMNREDLAGSRYAVINGDTITVSIVSDHPADSKYDVYEFSDIYPVYEDNSKIIPPTCTAEGYTEVTYLGKTYKINNVPAKHLFNKKGICIVCQKKLTMDDYHFNSVYNGNVYMKFPGADSITVTAHIERYYPNIPEYLPYSYVINDDGSTTELEEFETGKGRATAKGNYLNFGFHGPHYTDAFGYPLTKQCNYAVDSITPHYPKSLPVSGNVANINNEDDFYAFRSSISDGTNYSGITVNLNCDLDLTGVNLSGFDTNAGKTFCGTFNGNNHTIKGVTETGGEYGGLFHVLGSGAVIKDLTLANVNISTTGNAGAVASTATERVTISNVKVTGGTVTGKYSVGGLVGWFQKGADISGCSNGANVSGGEHCGGIGGCLQNDDKDYQYTMKNCSNSGAISATKHAGGIAGNLDTDNLSHDFSSCTNTGKITSNGDCAGGIVGRSEGGGNFKNCTNSGAVSSKNCAGGIMGWNEDDAIDFSGSKNSGTINATKDAGGIIGKFEGGNPFNFASCVNSASVTGAQTAGGIAGCVHNGGSHNFTYCQNSGAITETGQSNPLAAGGIVGVNRGKCNFTGSTNTGTIHGGYSAGGIIGYVDTHSDQNCYNCTNKASVTADVNCAGGITGQAYGGGNYYHCTNTGNITGKYAGGVLGWNEDDAIDFSQSTNSGHIYATKHTSDGCGGGIAGYLGHKDHDQTYKAANCVNDGSVTATWCAGGIIGYLYSDAASDRPHDLSWCRNSGTIRANRDCAGGIIGANFGYADFYRCSNSGNITAKTHAGGIFGWDEDDPVYAKYVNNTGTVSGGKSQGSIYGHLGGQIDTGKTVVGSVLSEGNLWIVIVVAVLAIDGVAALFILKKKKKPATANGASTEDDE